jgi:hypothetical protein
MSVWKTPNNKEVVCKLPNAVSLSETPCAYITEVNGMGIVVSAKPINGPPKCAVINLFPFSNGLTIREGVQEKTKKTTNIE